MAGPNLYRQLKRLLQGRDPTKPDKNRIGRKGFLRKATGQASKVTTGGEYDPHDPLHSEGRDYIDHQIWYYRTVAVSDQIKDPAGRANIQVEVIYLLAEKGMPQPTQRDKIVEIEHDLDGNPVLVDGEYVMAGKPIAINAFIPYWGDNDAEMVLYVALPSNPRSTIPSGLA